MLVSVWVPVLLLACEGVVSFFLAKASRWSRELWICVYLSSVWRAKVRFRCNTVPWVDFTSFIMDCSARMFFAGDDIVRAPNPWRAKWNARRVYVQGNVPSNPKRACDCCCMSCHRGEMVRWGVVCLFVCFLRRKQHSSTIALTVVPLAEASHPLSRWFYFIYDYIVSSSKYKY